MKNIKQNIVDIKKQEDLLLKKVKDLLDSIITTLKKSKNLGKTISKDPHIITVSLKDVQSLGSFNLSAEYYDSEYQIGLISKKIKDLTTIRETRDVISKIIDEKRITINKEKTPINDIVLNNLKKILVLLDS
jgi:hypothetical protein